MGRSSDDSKSLSFIQYIILIFVFCFFSGFILQLLLVGYYHDSHLLSSPALRAKYSTEKLFEDISNPNKEDIEDLHKRLVSATDNINYPLDTILKYGSGGEAEVPNIVKAWREAKLDWHQLLPKHNSIWERYGTPEKEGKFPLLVNKEQQATDYLTRFRESGLAMKYGKEHGSLLAYSGCNVFSEACMIHDAGNCYANNFCHWDNSTSLCMDGPSTDSSHNNNNNKCESPKTIKGNSITSINAKDCKLWIHQPTVLVNIDSESQTMFYHWWATWTGIRLKWEQTFKGDRTIHYIIPSIIDPMFFTYFGLISNYCWRRANNQIPPNTCFCNIRNDPASQQRIEAGGTVNQMMSYLNIHNVSPPPNKVKIGLISRRKKRFILNEYQLVDAVIAMGYECIILPLEAMTIYEQMKELRSLDILIGIHGSALDNSVFLNKGSVMIQLLPYKVEHRVTFQQSATQAGMIYMEWQLKDRTKAYFHWDLLNQADSYKLKTMSKEQILAAGQVGGSERETLMFWINQDIIVPLNEWKDLIGRAVKKCPAVNRGVDVTPLL